MRFIPLRVRLAASWPARARPGMRFYQNSWDCGNEDQELGSVEGPKGCGHGKEDVKRKMLRENTWFERPGELRAGDR